MEQSFYTGASKHPLSAFASASIAVALPEQGRAGSNSWSANRALATTHGNGSPVGLWIPTQLEPCHAGLRPARVNSLIGLSNILPFQGAD